MRLKIIIILLIIIFIGGFIIFTKNNKKNEQEFVVGISGGYAPYVSMNQTGEYEGFDIDVAQELAKVMNKKLVFKDLGSMTSLIIALEQGSIDAIMWGMSITQDRLKKFAMIRYQGEKTTSNPLVFWTQLPENIKTLADMRGKIVCVEPTSSQSDIVARCSDIQVLQTEKVDDALLALQYGKAAAAFIDPVIAQKFKAQYPEIKIVDVPLALEDRVYGVGIMMQRDRFTLINKVKKSIEVLITKDIIKQLEQKWGML